MVIDRSRRSARRPRRRRRPGRTSFGSQPSDGWRGGDSRSDSNDASQRLARAVRCKRFQQDASRQARGIIHYHAVIRLDAADGDHQPPPAWFSTALLREAIGQAAAIALDIHAHLDRLNARAASIKPGDTRSLPPVDAGLRRIVRFGTQTDARPISCVTGLPATGTDLPAPAGAPNTGGRSAIPGVRPTRGDGCPIETRRGPPRCLGPAPGEVAARKAPTAERGQDDV